MFKFFLGVIVLIVLVGSASAQFHNRGFVGNRVGFVNHGFGSGYGYGNYGVGFGYALPYVPTVAFAAPVCYQQPLAVAAPICQTATYAQASYPVATYAQVYTAAAPCVTTYAAPFATGYCGSAVGIGRGYGFGGGRRFR